jgi:transformation/transcription domain-associated protein
LKFLVSSSHNTQMRELFVELCLTVPVRLSVLLPHLSYLMRPLVIALQGGPELVSQSLRTLELCVDNLNQEFLEPIISPVIDELMAALYKHLKPAPYNQVYAHTTLRILGKFGGRNRRTLHDVSALEFNADLAPLTVSVFLEGATKSDPLQLQNALRFATEVLSSSTSSVNHRMHAFNFAKSCIPVIFEIKEIPSNFESGCAKLVEQFKSCVQEATATNGMDVDAELETPFREPLGASRVKLNTLETSLTEILLSLFSAATIPELADRSWSLIEHVCQFFTLIAIEEYIQTSQSKTSKSQQCYELLKTYALSRLNAFVEAIVRTIASDDSKKRDIGEKVLVFFHQNCVTILRDAKLTEYVPTFRILASRFCSSCYQTEWFKKTGGCFGMSVLCSKLGFSAAWILDYELEFVKALIFVLKDVPSNVTYFNLGDAQSNLEAIVLKCHSTPEETAEEKARFTSLLTLLISELPNAIIAVRETVQKVFTVLAEIKSTDVTELLTPVRERFLNPIYTKPLRALPFGLQIGFIDAITYCLNLRPVFLEFGNDLQRLIHEALALADAEDQALASKTQHFKSHSSVTNLRVVCIKLLSAVMSSPGFSSPKDSTARARIISVFFKSLYSKNQEVVEVAFVGLQQVMTNQHKIPKELLQAGLRPILVNLSDHKRLTVSNLEGLIRLLQLLTNYFRVEIGRKLLDHLRMWAPPNKLEEASGKPIADIEEIVLLPKRSILLVLYSKSSICCLQPRMCILTTSSFAC